ncbi:MAG TPA: hypothetical protein PJ986_21170 [Gammaproteobacteria bacterium]|nr:hypothetical protein [Gammaproteobacteria bacterium]
MERIKKALEEARAAREQALKAELERLVHDRAQATVASDAVKPRFDPVTERRIREFMPLRGLPADRLQAAIALGQVFGLATGELVFAAGDRHEYSHFLLEGAVQFFEGERVIRRLDATDIEALRPLDEPGTQRWTAAAEVPSRIFRVPRALLGGPDDLSATVAPMPPATYADTHSGEELAALVARIDAERHRTPAEPAAAASPLEATSYDFDLNGLMGDEEPPSMPPPLMEQHRQQDTMARDRLAEAMFMLEQRLRRHIADVRAQERANYETRMRHKLLELKQKAEAELRRKLVKLRERDKEVMAQREALLRERYAQLQRIAHRFTHQKAQIQHAKRELEEKLRAADVIHRELNELGQYVTRQLDDLDHVFGGSAAPGGSDDR